MTRGRWIVVGIAGVVGIAFIAGVISAMGQRSITPTESMASPQFIEVTGDAGINHSYDGDWRYFVGGGVAAFDCDGDADPDLYFAGGENPAALYRNMSTVAGPLALSAVPSSVTDLTGVTGAYPLDIDSDAVTDLVILRLGENVLLRGLGDCAFERANEDWNFDGGDAWTTAMSATWEGNNTFPTLAFGNYVALDDKGNQTTECSNNVLVRPQDDGYTDVTPLDPSWCTLSVLFTDWDRSGGQDLRVANDRHYYRNGEEQLWNIVDGEQPSLYTRDEGWKKLQIWGMGIASNDVTGDGYPEVYLTSQGDNKLQSLTDGSDQPLYGDIAIRRGVLAHRPYTGDDVMPSTAWHPEFQDVNSDSFMDLYVSKGNVDAMPEFAAKDPNNLFLGQPDGTFVEAAGSAGTVHFARTRGAALVDLNLDGMLDLVEVNRVENVKTWRNTGWGTADDPQQMGNWIAVELSQPSTNRDAVGSWIEVTIGDRTIVREVMVGGGHAGGQLGWSHFGLGPASRAEVRVIWPDGEESPWMPVSANQFITIT
ncbi:MAG: CRTAC1 family protein, partial [Actinomycetia bacterium]|nr:CRTAC1 family protein [Actinomycetes bacterium]